MKKKEKEVQEQNQQEEVKVDENLKKIEELEKELATWKDKAYRTIADCDNLRKSYERDHLQMVKYRGQPFVEKLLPTLDSFYLVLKITPEDQMLKNYLIGFQMIYNGMLQALQDEGVEQVFPKIGEEFDANYMQAIDVVEGEEDDKITDVSKPGYKLRDRLIRPAMVVVSKKKVVEEDENKENLN